MIIKRLSIRQSFILFAAFHLITAFHYLITLVDNVFKENICLRFSKYNLILFIGFFLNLQLCSYLFSILRVILIIRIGCYKLWVICLVFECLEGFCRILGYLNYWNIWLDLLISLNTMWEKRLCISKIASFLFLKCWSFVLM